MGKKAVKAAPRTAVSTDGRKKKMQYRKFILSLTDDGVQEAELNRFLRGHRILKVEQHFLPDDGLWAFLVSYLDGEGLKVMSLEQDWTAYPVIHLDLSIAKGMDSVEDLRRRLSSLLQPYAEHYGAEADNQHPGGTFTALIRRAYEQTGQQQGLLPTLKASYYGNDQSEIPHRDSELREAA